MSAKIITLSATVLAVGLATPTIAESTGELVLTIAGEEEVIPLWGTQSDWSGSANWPSINIYARSFNEDGEDPLVVTLGFDAPGWTPSQAEMRLSRYEGGDAVLKLFANEDEEDGGLAVKLDSHALEGTLMSLTGSVTGTLGTSDNYGRDIDLSDGIPVDGVFTVTLEELD
ncbi:hypothetical protein ABMC89_15860 [Sulfitobacter sp. HNIBRBA3233]|uniref:hypothetical protein n=1 Tax=Sulfitobacter marinivivus TaxID=3158558 RepID=UPI0032E02105